MLFTIKKILFLLLIVGAGIIVQAFNPNQKLKSLGFNKSLPPDSLFLPNEENGWGNYETYLHNDEDSVEFELILFRNMPDSTDWALPSEIGTIDNTYAPQETQVMEFKEVIRYWQLTIQPDAKCFIVLLSGPSPSGNPVIIPLKTKFKK